MGRLFYKPENAWVGDLIPYYENGTYYGFYLHDPRIRDKEYAEDTTWHLIETKDFVNLDYKGESIARGGIHDANKNAYTGSVIKCEKDGLYHVFYTAYNEDFKFRGKTIQSVMQATGKNLENLETVKDFLFVSDGKQYEEFDWRDPFVFWNDEDQCYYMLLASRVTNRGDLRGGCIALCKSEDLINWTYEKPFYDPKMYITMECPELFKMGEYWYLVFSTFSDQFTTHYRISKNWNGPWEIPDDDVFDTRADYAIKTASDGKRRFAFGWIASKYGNTDFGPWEWGGTMNFHEIIQNSKNGELRIKAIPEVLDYFSKEIELKKETLYNCKMVQAQDGVSVESDTLGALLYPLEGDTFALDMVIKPERYHEFGIALHVDKELETGYFLRMNPKNQLVAWDMWPRGEQGRYQWQIKGDVPYQIETARKLPKAEEYRVHIIKEKDICVVYINDEIVLSTRMYNHKDGYAGIYVVQGNVKLIQYKEKRSE